MCGLVAASIFAFLSLFSGKKPSTMIRQMNDKVGETQQV
jgi:hypothetical protein